MSRKCSPLLEPRVVSHILRRFYGNSDRTWTNYQRGGRCGCPMHRRTDFLTCVANWACSPSNRDFSTAAVGPVRNGLGIGGWIVQFGFLTWSGHPISIYSLTLSMEAGTSVGLLVTTVGLEILVFVRPRRGECWFRMARGWYPLWRGLFCSQVQYECVHLLPIYVETLLAMKALPVLFWKTEAIFAMKSLAESSLLQSLSRK